MGKHVKGVPRRLEPPPCAPASLDHSFPRGAGSKDTATLWESLRLVEMADKLGQKLEEEEPVVRVCREGTQPVKCLSCNCEDQSSILGSHVKKLGMVVCL